MSIIDDLKRLERVGSETSRVTEKLRKAASRVAGEIVKSIPDECHGYLPRGYSIANVYSQNMNSGESYLVNAGGQWLETSGGYLFGDFNCPLPDSPSRQSLLDFARDISDGLLAEIADWIDERKQEAINATEKLESA